MPCRAGGRFLIKKQTLSLARARTRISGTVASNNLHNGIGETGRRRRVNGRRRNDESSFPLEILIKTNIH